MAEAIAAEAMAEAVHQEVIPEVQHPAEDNTKD